MLCVFRIYLIISIEVITYNVTNEPKRCDVQNVVDSVEMMQRSDLSMQRDTLDQWQRIKRKGVKSVHARNMTGWNKVQREFYAVAQRWKKKYTIEYNAEWMKVSRTGHVCVSTGSDGCSRSGVTSHGGGSRCTSSRFLSKRASRKRSLSLMPIRTRQRTRRSFVRLIPNKE